MKTFRLNELKNAGIEMREYQIKELNERQKLCSEVEKFHHAYITVNASEQEGKLYYERSEVNLTNSKAGITVTYDDYRKKYYLYSNTSYHFFENLTSYDIKKIEEKYTKPNYIGVLNAKKINDWKEYLTAIYSDCKELNKQKGSQVNDFLKSIENMNVRWFTEGKQGEIVVNGIEYSFTINDGYVSTQMKIHYKVDTTLSNFIKLSTNQYGK